MRLAQGRTVTYFDFGFLHEPLFMILAPGSAHTIIRQANLMSGPFLCSIPRVSLWRKLIAKKFDGSKVRKSWGRPRVDEETERLGAADGEGKSWVGL
jgi:hypothetical protein